MRRWSRRGLELLRIKTGGIGGEYDLIFIPSFPSAVPASSHNGELKSRVAERGAISEAHGAEGVANYTWVVRRAGSL